MKKNIVFVWIISICILALSINAFANINNDFSNKSVYASKDIQTMVCTLIQNSSSDLSKQFENDGIKVLEASITPVYTADFLEYAETGKFNIEPLAMDNTNGTNDNGDGMVYIAKTITDKGEFAGIVRFYVEDNFVHSLGFTPTPVLEQYFDSEYGYVNNASMVSRSYADHAERIQNLLRIDSFVSTTDIRYVMVENLGEVFYVENNGTESLICISASNEIFSGGTGEIVRIDDQLRNKADGILCENKEHLSYVDEWQAAYPDEVLLPPGSNMNITMNMTMYSVSNDTVNNVINIAEYLHLDTAMNSSFENHTDIPITQNWIYVCVGIAFGAIAITIVVIVNSIAKKRKTKPAQI